MSSLASPALRQLTLLIGIVALAAARDSAPSTVRFEQAVSQSETTRLPVHTFSIVARDPDTGQLGVAVASHWFAAGRLVAWAEAGVGAVATQAFVEPAYGQRGLDLLRQGKSAPDALQTLLGRDADREVRQVALIDAQGRVDAFTGKRTIAAAGHHSGKEYAVQANLMKNDNVWPEMARAFEGASGDLAERMLIALEAAQSSGGDLRGKQSAALIVVAAKPSGRPWEDRVFDVRVDDHKEPIKELRRLVNLERAYQHMVTADRALERHEPDEARSAYRAAEKLAPKHIELVFWHAIALVNMNRTEDALPLLKRVFAAEGQFRELIPRLAKAGLIPDDAHLSKRLANPENP